VLLVPQVKWSFGINMKNVVFIFLISFFLVPSAEALVIKKAYKKRVRFTTAGATTWTVPSGVTKVMGEVWGGGGGRGGAVALGGGSCGTPGPAYYGGTGGSSSISGFSAPSPASVTVTGGAGGSGLDTTYCTCFGSGGAGGSCTSTDDYECVTGSAGSHSTGNRCGGLTDYSGGTTASSAASVAFWGTTLAGAGTGESDLGWYTGGGGGSGYAVGVFTVTPGNTLTITVGGGGATGTGGGGGAGSAGEVAIWY